jgi:hypothetical protein
MALLRVDHHVLRKMTQVARARSRWVREGETAGGGRSWGRFSLLPGGSLGPAGVTELITVGRRHYRWSWTTQRETLCIQDDAKEDQCRGQSEKELKRRGPKSINARKNSLAQRLGRTSIDSASTLHRTPIAPGRKGRVIEINGVQILGYYPGVVVQRLTVLLPSILGAFLLHPVG